MPGELHYRPIDVKSVTSLHTVTDPWFLGRYGMNLYRGCEHACVYCDGRAEKYHVEGQFDRDIVVKRNAPGLLDAELSRIREPGFVFVGGGVSDAWQPADASFQLARSALEVVLRRGLPVHVLTKSSLVERDFDLLEAIHRKAGVILSFSIQSVDEAVRETFEPGAAPIAERWRLLRRAHQLGFGTGVMAMPVLPGISDQPEAIDALAAEAADSAVDFLCFGGLTLRPGAQKAAYLQVLRERIPSLLDGYERIFSSHRASGAADPRYYARVEARFIDALRKRRIPARIPRRLFSGKIPVYTEVAVLLEHREMEMKMAGLRVSGLSRAGEAIQAWSRGRLSRAARGGRVTYQGVEDEFLAMMRDRSILSLDGVSAASFSVMQEIVGDVPARHPALLPG